MNFLRRSCRRLPPAAQARERADWLRPRYCFKGTLGLSVIPWRVRGLRC